MFQPFERFHAKYITGLINLKKIYLVTQTYNRGFDHFENDVKTNILITDYENKVEADIHYNAVKGDKYASIMNLENEKHKEKLIEMLNVNSKYCVYWAIVKDAKSIMKTLDLKYKDNVRRYIANKTNLRLKPSETLFTSLVVNFGEIYLVIKAGNKPITVIFGDIEKS
jgi:hypothetical protein